MIHSFSSLPHTGVVDITEEKATVNSFSFKFASKLLSQLMDNVAMTFFWFTWVFILLIVLLLAKIFQLHKDSDVFDEVFKTGQTVNTTQIPNSQTCTVQNVIVQIPEEGKNKDNPPDYSNFLPPSYEEAVERENISIGVEPSNQINNTNWLRKYL